MKRFLSALVLLAMLTVSAHAEVVLEQTSVNPAAQTSISVSSDAMSAVSAATSKINKISARTNKRLNAVEDAQKMSNGFISTLANGMGKLIDAVSTDNAELSAKVDGIPAKVADYIAEAVLVIVIAMLILAAIFGILWGYHRKHTRSEAEAVAKEREEHRANLAASVCAVKKSVDDTQETVVRQNAEILELLKGVDQKVDNVPEATVKAVNAYFNREPLKARYAGHEWTFHQNPEVLDRRAYQTLYVDKNISDGNLKVENLLLDERSSREGAEDSLRRTMRDFYSGGLREKAKSGNVPAKLTLQQIDRLQKTSPQRLEINKL